MANQIFDFDRQKNRPAGFRRVAAVVGGLALLPVLAADAGGEPLTTDRPDFVESSSTVGKGVIQLETSVAFERTEQGPLTAETLNTPTLVRVGFHSEWEARLETGGAVRAEVEDEVTRASATDEGLSDVSVGVKWHTHDGEPGTPRPAIGWLLHADLDVGSSEFRGDGTRPSLRMSAPPRAIRSRRAPSTMLRTASAPVIFSAGSVCSRSTPFC